MLSTLQADHRVPCLVIGSAPSWQPRPVHRLGRRGAAQSHPLHSLQHALPDLPWVRVEHLASHILGRMAARISDDWSRCTVIDLLP